LNPAKLRKRGPLRPVLALLAGAAAAHAAQPINVGQSDNEFGFRLLNVVQKTRPRGNVLLSPVSAALNLALVLNAAAGETRDEMLAVLSLSGDLAADNAANARLLEQLRTPAKNITLSVADSLWVDSRRATLRAEYLKPMQAWYGAQIINLDFSDPAAASRINSWAAQETLDRIPKVIDRIDPADVSLLLDAVYFKGQWTHEFDRSQTQPRDFALADGSVKKVPRMAQSGRFDYFETPEIQGIRLPFGDGDLSLQVLLPATSSSLAALEAELTPEQWTAWQGQYALRTGKIELPRFELEATYRLNGPLKTLGMNRAFRPGVAQFTGFFEPAAGHAGRFVISGVTQSVYWKVDEEGSEAAAVTTTGVRATAITRPPAPFQMIVDRPYFCAILDKRSGALLFLGAIYDPSG
jgi:serpin B